MKVPNSPQVSVVSDPTPRRRRSSAIGLASLALILSIAPGAFSQPSAPKSPPAKGAPAKGAPAKGAAAKGATDKGAPAKGAPAKGAPAKGAPDKGATAKGAPVDAPATPDASAAPAAPPAPPVETPPIPTVVRKTAPPPPPPSPAQLAALAELEKEADAYESAARDYRGAITRIVQHHYEDRRRRVLSALDTEIDTERKGLREAREEAIRRLEIFVGRYSGANAHPEDTPRSMFQLAALYEERARTDLDTMDDVSVGLRPAIALYKRVIREFPQYVELAGIYYYLGHALNDSNRFAEAQQVWRSLVCHNTYVYPAPVDPKDADRDLIAKIPQDHDRDYWTGWEARHPIPIGLAAGRGKPKGAAAPKKTKGPEPVGGSTSLDDEVSFRNPFTSECKALPQKTLAGSEPRYLAEVWWLIGDYYFNEIDPAGGPFNYNRADAAYQQSIKFKKPPVHGVSMYKLAWTYYKQQRYETSVRQFIDLLRYNDEQEKLTGDPGTDFRAEAYTYIAGSLAYIDFVGPAADEPYVPRNDVLDTESDPRVAEQKMRIAIDRVQDAKLIPQNEKWSVDVYKALAQEFKELHQLRNEIEISEIILKKWPMYRDAPGIQDRIATIYDELTAQSREGTAERASNSSKALDARTKLSRYIGTSDWVEANKKDPEAIQAAERLVRGGLRRAAADHTNAGSALVQQAISIGDKESRDPLFDRALAEYKLAAQGWTGYLSQDENSPDAYESRYWLADAHHNVVSIKVAMEQTPTATEVETARKTAIAVRDSNEDDKYLQPAAVMVVDIAQQVLNDQYKVWERTSGAQGIELRKEVKTTGTGEQETLVTDPIPAAAIAAISSRDEYILRVPPAQDPAKNADLFAYQAADFFFLYGHFEEAKKRFEPIYRDQCGKTEYGYKAWIRLTTMANIRHDIPAGRALAAAAVVKSCAMDAGQKKKETEIATGTISTGYYVDAEAAFKRAQGLKDGDPERPKAWREAGSLYKVALEKAPALDAAPEAAINGAFSYKQVGDYDQAIEMYTLFIKEYGNDQNLTKLEKGDSAVTPPKPPNPEKYKERVTYLKQAYDALSAAYVLFFNYRTAAETYDTISRNPRFAQADRREASRNAVVLYANIGDQDKMNSSRATFLSLAPPAERKAEIDYLVASADLKTWDEHGPDEGANRTARVRAVASMDGYFNANKANTAATAYVVEAAFHAAKMRKKGQDSKAAEWCKNTITAFEKFRSTSPIVEGHNRALGSPQADMAAECAYGALDEKIKAEFDYDTNHHRYAGVIDKVKKTFDEDIKKAEGYFNLLQDVINKFESRPWSVASRARQGSLYDSCRTGLFNARPPGLKLYTEKEEKLLKMAEGSDREDLQEQADAIRQRRREDWRSARERSLNDADKAMVKFYVEAVVWGRAWKVRNPAVDFAIQRLAFFTDILGDDKLRTFSAGINEPDTKKPFEYKEGIFLRTRPGMTPPLTPDGLPLPRPVLP